MKKIIVLSALALLVGGLLLRLAQKDPGYVLIVGWGTTVEMRLGFAVVVLVLISLVLAFGLRSFLRLISGVKKRVFQWQLGKQEKHHSHLEAGVYALVEGNWQTGQKALLKAAKNKSRSALPLVAAALCAEQAQKPEEAALLIDKAEQAGADALTVLLLRVQLSWQSNQLAQCLTLLNQAKQVAPNNLAVLRWLHKVYVAQHDWLAVEGVMPELEKQKVFTEVDLAARKKQLCYARLGVMGAELEALIDGRGGQAGFKRNGELGGESSNTRATHSAGPTKALEGSESAPSPVSADEKIAPLKTAVEAYWKALPKHLQSDAEFIERYCHILRLLGEPAKAEAMIRVATRSGWHGNLVLLYGLLQSPQPKRQLQVAQEWEAGHQDAPELHLTLGRLCVKNQLWGQARDYFQKSLSLKPDAVVFAELANLLAHIGEADRSVAMYKAGLLHSSNLADTAE